MPLAQLLAALEHEAERAADRVLASARAEAERITAGTESTLERRRDAAVAVATQEQLAAMERAASAAARAALRDTLTAREQVLARVFGAVRAALPALIARPAYLATLEARVAAALECFDPDESTVLRCAPSLLATVQPLVAERTNVTVEASPDAGHGFRLATSDGAIEVNDTLEQRLEAAQPSLARRAMRQLSGAA